MPVLATHHAGHPHNERATSNIHHLLASCTHDACCPDMQQQQCCRCCGSPEQGFVQSLSDLAATDSNGTPANRLFDCIERLHACIVFMPMSSLVGSCCHAWVNNLTVMSLYLPSTRCGVLPVQCTACALHCLGCYCRAAVTLQVLHGTKVSKCHAQYLSQLPR
jgi:hypothetical protein